MSAPISFACPECGAHIKAPAEFAGKRARCPKCKAAVLVPDGDEELAPEEAGHESFEDDAPAAEGAPPPLPDDEAEAGVEPEEEPAEAGGRSRRRMSERYPPPPPPKVGPGLFGAIGGAVVGAVVWAAIAYFANYEIGWIAWGIGLAVGGGCVALGGRGQQLAVVCAALTLVSILGGKYLGTKLIFEKVLSEGIGVVSQEQYDTWKTDWTAFAKLPAQPSDEQLRQFMSEYEYHAEAPDDIPPADVEEFRLDNAPFLRGMAERSPSIGDAQGVAAEVLASNVSIIDLVVDELNLMDLLFAALGIASAFGLVQRATDAAATRAVAEAQAESGRPRRRSRR